MSVDRREVPEVPGLAPEAVDRVLVELGLRGHKVISCLRTAAGFVAEARTADDGLRWAESAAYNLREAFDAVVAAEAIPEGGVGSVIDAWMRYRIAVQTPGGDEESARVDLHGFLDELERDEQRQGMRTRQLLEYIRGRTGIDPLPGAGDPAARYNKLRGRAAGALHRDGNVDGVSVLYDESVGWFGRFFTPPDVRVQAIAALAEQDYTAELIDQARELIVDGHHLWLFYSRLRDPEWLDALYDNGLMPLPRVRERWPVAALAGDDCTIDPVRVGGVLLRLLADSRTQPEPARTATAREILTVASRLGPAGYSTAEKVINQHRGDDWVQLVASSIGKRAEPEHPIQLTIARAIVGSERRSDGGYRTREAVERLALGLTEDNAADRMKMVGASIRALSPERVDEFARLDIAALDAPGDDLREPVIILAQYFVQMIPVARQLGLPSAEVLKVATRIPGELGERIICRVLAGAEDVDRTTKVRHIEQRLAATRATGDDRHLIDDVLTNSLSPEEAASWRAALGEPAPAPEASSDDGRQPFGDNWAKAWRWAPLLPSEVLAGWEDAIAAVSARHGEPSVSSFDTRVPAYMSARGSSPYTSSEIAEIPVLDAAAFIAAWRPAAEDPWGVSARELARTLEAVVEDDWGPWTEDPEAVVRALREPVYVDHYLRAVADKAADLAGSAPALLHAAQVALSERWQPAILGRDNYEFEPDWSGVETATVELIGDLAWRDGDLGDDLDTCWTLATELLHQMPDDLPELVDEDPTRADAPLNRALNRNYGKALENLLALAYWEHEHLDAPSNRLLAILDEMIAVPGSVGLELRSILVRRRPLLEAVASDWIDNNAEALFITDPLGPAAFDQTLLWSKPTTWFYARYQDQLVAAIRRRAENAARWFLIALLWDEPGYTFENLAAGLRSDVEGWKVAADEMASLMQSTEADDPQAALGVKFWSEMLDADRTVVPAKALTGLGRWTFVKALNDERFLELMERTVTITKGDITLAIEVADRCRDAQPSTNGLRILTMMIGRGDVWEQHHTETAGIEALRAGAAPPVEEDVFLELRSRLIQRGHHEAADIQYTG